LMSSRTYNLGAGATYGQFVPAQMLHDALLSGETALLPQISTSDSYRTNLGFSETRGADASVRVSLFNETGDMLGQGTFDVPALGHLQVNNIFSALGVSGDVYIAYATVEVVDGAGGVLAYASVVDNRTGDAIFIPADR